MDAWQHSRRIFHTLNGTLATFGWGEWAALARRAEAECSRAVQDPAVRTWEILTRCRVEADDLSQRLAQLAPGTPRLEAGETSAKLPVPVATPSVFPGWDRAPRILVVDDSRSVRTLLERLLGEWGCEVTVAAEGQEALIQLNLGTAFDLIVTDLEMPGINGLELLRRLSQDPRWQAVPSLVLSSSSRHGIQDEVAALGARRFMGKPFEANQLLENLLPLLSPPRLAAPVRLELREPKTSASPESHE